MDWFEFDYWRTFEAYGDVILFNSEIDPIPKSSVFQYTLTGFSNQLIDLYRIVNGGIEARLVGGENGTEEPNYNLVFQDQILQRTQYAALSRSAYYYIPKLIRAKPSDLRRPANQADYIVISHQNFLQAIQPLVKFRQLQGLNVKVVDVDEMIYSLVGFSTRMLFRSFYGTPILTGKSQLPLMFY